MTRKSKPPPVKFEFKGFINVMFSHEEQCAVIADLEKKAPEIEDSVVTLVEAEYKVGISYDLRSDAYNIVATCKRERSPYYGYCFTFKHIDLARGLSIFRWFYDHHLAEEAYVLPEKDSKWSW